MGKYIDEESKSETLPSRNRDPGGKEGSRKMEIFLM